MENLRIVFEEEQRLFHLTNGRMSYCFQVQRDGYLAHLYWGKGVRQYRVPNPVLNCNRGFAPHTYEFDRYFSLDLLPQEYPAYGNGDFRPPAVQVQTAQGDTISDLRYAGYEIIQGKPKLTGLPAVYTEAESEAMTLKVTLRDDVTGLKAALCYTIFAGYDVLCRSVQFFNEGSAPLRLLNAASCSVDFRDGNFEMISLYGGHCDERNFQRAPLFHGTQQVESARGASSHQFSPFAALVRPETTETAGEAYGFSFVYSGNFLARAHLDQASTLRFTMGLNPFDFSWLLQPGESFQAPEVVMAYSSRGLGEMSRTYHRLYRQRLCRGRFRDELRPVLINNWEATYFHFDPEKIFAIAQNAKELGMELLVLDDGWFGHRDDDNSSLGDWTVYEEKMPGGLDRLIDRVTGLGLRFGLWFEPEMVSLDSDLYRAHPDWCIHVEGRPLTFGRHQLVLDFSRTDVCDYMIEAIAKVLENNKITYVKWDMNRHMTDIGSVQLPAERQRETAHRYMLGLYRVLEELTGRFPHVLFESCSGGGGRFDAGMLYYMPQTWTSDNTDAVCRLHIQYGTSMAFPAVSMGAHVSVTPNHQVGRVTPLETRGACAMSGNLGYELDITRLPEKEQQLIREQVAFYKDIRPVVQFGDFYRLLSPVEGNETAWNFVAPDKSRMVAMYFKVLAEPNGPVTTLRFQGLDETALYRDEATGEVFGGDELMNVGVSIAWDQRDFVSKVWVFAKEDVK